MSKVISKTIRISKDLACEIEAGAYKEYKLKEMFQENLLRMEQDEAYKKEQHELAEADFL